MAEYADELSLEDQALSFDMWIVEGLTGQVSRDPNNTQIYLYYDKHMKLSFDLDNWRWWDASMFLVSNFRFGMSSLHDSRMFVYSNLSNVSSMVAYHNISNPTRILCGIGPSTRGRLPQLCRQLYITWSRPTRVAFRALF